MHPPTMPSALMMSIDAERSISYSRSESVSAGATTIESPVCTPTGSTFSMLHTAIQLPMPSRMASNSISFHPKMYFSTRIWEIGEASIPPAATSLSCVSSYATPPPLPPRVNAGLTMTGYPILPAASSAPSTVEAMSEGIQGMFMDCIVSLNSSLSSARHIALAPVPISLTPCFARKPSFSSCIESVSPVCPPSVPRTESGFSLIIILFTVSSVSGSVYIASASAASVIMVAGLEFKSTTLIPSAFKTRHA